MVLSCAASSILFWLAKKKDVNNDPAAIDNPPADTGLSEKGSKDGTVTALGALIGADEVACGEENQNKHLGSITSSWTEVDIDSALKLSKKQSAGTPLQLPAPRLVCQRRPPKLPQTAGSWNCWPSSPTPAYQVGLESAPSWPSPRPAPLPRLRGRPSPRSPLALPVSLATFGFLARASLCSFR